MLWEPAPSSAPGFPLLTAYGEGGKDPAPPGWGWEPPGATDAPVPAPHLPSAALIPPFEFVHP